MSESNNVGKKNHTTFAVLAGVLAIGILASAFAGSFAISNAVAQSSSGEGRTVTSIDDIDCSKVRSVVHCVEETAGNTSTSSFHYAATATVSTSGTASTSVKPNKFSVTVGVETDGSTAEEAAAKNSDLMAKVLAALRALGISGSQISTSNYNLFPIYEHKELAEVCIMIYPPPPECLPRQEIVGYRAVNNITVTLDVDGGIDAGQVIDAAVKAGASNVNGVYFFISAERQEEIRASLIRDAIANAKHQAEIAADALGMSISGVKSVNLNDVYFPVFVRDAAESRTPILPGEQQVSTSVNVVFFMSGSEGAA
jgi:uncharacterized protein YggE